MQISRLSFAYRRWWRHHSVNPSGRMILTGSGSQCGDVSTAARRPICKWDANFPGQLLIANQRWTRDVMNGDWSITLLRSWRHQLMKSQTGTTTLSISLRLCKFYANAMQISRSVRRGNETTADVNCTAGGIRLTRRRVQQQRIHWASLPPPSLPPLQPCPPHSLSLSPSLSHFMQILCKLFEISDAESTPFIS